MRSSQSCINSEPIRQGLNVGLLLNLTSLSPALILLSVYLDNIWVLWGAVFLISFCGVTLLVKWTKGQFGEDFTYITLLEDIEIEGHRLWPFYLLGLPLLFGEGFALAGAVAYFIFLALRKFKISSNPTFALFGYTVHHCEEIGLHILSKGAEHKARFRTIRLAKGLFLDLDK